MIRDELLELFESSRQSIKTVIERVMPSCGASDLNRAAKNMAVLVNGSIKLPGDGWGYPLVCDVALFEANDRGVRPFDRFLTGPARALAGPEQDLARRMGRAFFSLFKFTAMHETGGIWVEDILDDNRRIWIMEILLEDREKFPEIFGMRIFDAGPFHLSLGSIAYANASIVRICATAVAAKRRLPFRHGLASTLYGLMLMRDRPNHPSGIRFVRDLALVLNNFPAAPTPDNGKTARGP